MKGSNGREETFLQMVLLIVDGFLTIALRGILITITWIVRPLITSRQCLRISP